MSLLVIDLGSSSVRALLFSDCARLLADSICSRPHDFQTDRAGRATADADELGLLVEACIDEALLHPAARSIRAVGMASFVCNWLGLDDKGAPCTEVFTYADTRSAGLIPQLLAQLDGDADRYHQATGCLLHPAYLPAQYLGMLGERPQVETRVRSLSDVGAWLYRRWFGRPVPMSYSVASWTGLLDTARRRWHTGYAGLLVGKGFSARLPLLADFDAAEIGLADVYADRWKPLRATPFYLALGDGAVANVGSGAVDASHIALTIGTTSALRVVKDSARVPSGLWRYLVSEDMPLIGGATSEGGNVYQWTVEALRLSGDALEAELRRRLPDAHGLTVLPLLAGERAPGWGANAAGTIHGLRRHTSGLDILQAQLEAVALRLSLIFDMLNSDKAQVMAGGGALQASPAWQQMIADAFDRPLHILAEPEITARGVALMMRRQLDGVPLDADPPTIATRIEPAPDRVERMRAARDRQIDLYRRLYG